MHLIFKLILILKKIYLRICISKINFFYKLKPKPNHDYDYLINLLENKSIALVGNSITLLNKKNLIDDYDIVIRINHLPDKIYYPKIGKRCDILMLNKGPMLLIDPSYVKIMMYQENYHYSNYVSEKIYHYRPDWFNELYNILNAKPSAGACALHFLTKILKNPNITLFGFTHDFRGWYHTVKLGGFLFNRKWTPKKLKKVADESSKLKSPTGHDFIKEKKFFQSIINNNIQYSK